MFQMLQTGLEEINLNGSADGTADDSNCMGVVGGGPVWCDSSPLLLWSTSVWSDSSVLNIACFKKDFSIQENGGLLAIAIK